MEKCTLSINCNFFSHRTGDLDYRISLRLIQYLKQEEEFLPLQAGLSMLTDIYLIMKRTPHYGLFQNFMRDLLEPIYQNLKNQTQNEASSVLKRKVLVWEWACRFNVGNCEEHAISLFQTWMRSESPDNENA